MQDLLLYFHLPFLVLAIITGYEIGSYFIWLFLIKRREGRRELKLNKLLLAYGILYLFVNASVTVRTIYTYIIVDEFVRLILYHLSHFLIFGGAAIFLYILASKVFDQIVKTYYTIITASIAILTSIIVTFVQDISILIITIFIAFGIAGLYLVIFHIKLINLTTGKIKRRISTITLGNVFIVFGVLFQADELITIFPYEDQVILMILANPIFLLGSVIVFLGLFRFPAFLEFYWKEDLINFYIINNEDLCLLYHYDFKKKEELNSKENTLKTEIGKVLPKGILGVENIFSILTKTNEKVKIIKHGDLNVLLSQGDAPLDNITYILLVNSEMNSHYYFINKLKSTFQDTYGLLLNKLELVEEEDFCLFLNYDQEIQDFLR